MFLDVTDFGETGGSDESHAIQIGVSLTTSLTIEDSDFSQIEGTAIDISNNGAAATLSGDFNLNINRNTFTDIGNDAASNAGGILINVAGTATTDRVIATIDDNTFTGVAGNNVDLQISGTSGSALSRNTIAINNINATDGRADGVTLSSIDNTFVRVDIAGGSLTGVGADAGLNRAVSATADGSTDLELAVSGMTLDNYEDEGVSIVAAAASSATVTASVSGMTINNMGSAGLRVTNSGSTLINATITSNDLNLNGAETTFDYNASSGSVTALNLNSNDDSVGFTLNRDADGILQFGGTLGVGSAFDDDNGNISANGNQTNGAAPFININGSGNQIQIVNPATIPSP